MSRIVLVADDLFPLGEGGALRYLAEGLAEREWDVHLAVLREGGQGDAWPRYDAEGRAVAGSRESSSTQDHRSPHAPFQIHRLGQGRRATLATSLRLRKLIRRLAPDHVHGWGIQASLTLGIAQLGRTGKRSASLFDLAPSVPFRALWVATRELRKAALVIPHASAIAPCRERGLIGPATPTTMIPGGIQPLGGNRQKARQRLRECWGHACPGSPASASTTWIGTCAPLEPVSRIKDLIWSIALLNVAGIPAQLIVWGEGTQLRLLQSYCELAEVMGKVHFPGRDPDVLEQLPGLDVYWHSHAEQPLPIDLMIAMANRIPVVSVLAPATEDLVLPQSTALATNVGARDEYARWTKYLIEQPEQTARLVDQAERWVLGQYPADQMVDQYARFFCSLDG